MEIFWVLVGLLVVATTIFFIVYFENTLIILTVVSIVAALIVGALQLAWNKAGLEARLVNTKYHTNYTTSDMFYAVDTIKQVIVGTEHNVNIERNN